MIVVCYYFFCYLLLCTAAYCWCYFLQSACPANSSTTSVNDVQNKTKLGIQDVFRKYNRGYGSRKAMQVIIRDPRRNFGSAYSNRYGQLSSMEVFKMDDQQPKMYTHASEEYLRNMEMAISLDDAKNTILTTIHADDHVAVAISG